MNSESRITPYPLRIDSDTRAKIEALAKANGRSLNAQITLMLDEWLSGNGTTNGQPLSFEDIRRVAKEAVQEQLKTEKALLEKERQEIEKLLRKAESFLSK